MIFFLYNCYRSITAYIRAVIDVLMINFDRCRFGVFHVVNNDYVNWEKYAIGGSASPTILSQGNRFYADKEKEVRFHCAVP